MIYCVRWLGRQVPPSPFLYTGLTSPCTCIFFPQHSQVTIYLVGFCSILMKGPDALLSIAIMCLMQEINVGAILLAGLVVVVV